MPHKMKWTILPILFFLLSSMQVHASDPMEPQGIILGGSLDSPVRIEVFSNYECTACREYYLRTIKKILREYSNDDRVCIIYHDFPFRSHKYDREAASYTEAASRVSRETIIQVMDALYTDQASWSHDGKLKESIAKTVPKDNFEKLMEMSKDPEIEHLIDAQYNLAMELDLSSTPVSFIFYTGKEKKVNGLLTYLMMKTFIDKIIK